MTDVTLYNITFIHTRTQNMLQDMKECVTIIISKFKFELVKIWKKNHLYILIKYFYINNKFINRFNLNLKCKYDI